LTGCSIEARGVRGSGGAAAVLDPAEFFGLVDRLGPYETAPHVAVAVSGGPDSLALTLLLANWVLTRGGRLEALTVDHGLRPESADEAASVGRKLKGRGIPHYVLKWSGARPEAGLQEAAREARYALLLDWCTRAGILHLFLAHHLEDQAETFLMRVARGSGRSGLAGMSPIVEHRGVRLLRPCLGIARDRLRATLDASGLVPVQDPSNEEPRFTRVRVRAQLPALARADLGPARLAAAARSAAISRRTLEHQVARGLAATTTLHPAGFARVRPEALRDLPPKVRPAVLYAILSTVGGHRGPLRRRRVERLSAWLTARVEGRRELRAATLAGCLIVPHRGELLVCREPAAAAERLRAEAPGAYLWDGRFEIELEPGHGKERRQWGTVWIARLGEDGWKQIVQCNSALRESHVPWPARPSLPAVRDGRDRVLEVRHLAYRRDAAMLGSLRTARLPFRPARPLAGAGFMVA